MHAYTLGKRAVVAEHGETLVAAVLSASSKALARATASSRYVVQRLLG